MFFASLLGSCSRQGSYCYDPGISAARRHRHDSCTIYLGAALGHFIYLSALNDDQQIADLYLTADFLSRSALSESKTENLSFDKKIIRRPLFSSATCRSSPSSATSLWPRGACVWRSPRVLPSATSRLMQLDEERLRTLRSLEFLMVKAFNGTCQWSESVEASRKLLFL